VPRLVCTHFFGGTCIIEFSGLKKRGVTTIMPFCRRTPTSTIRSQIIEPGISLYNIGGAFAGKFRPFFLFVCLKLGMGRWVFPVLLPAIWGGFWES